MQGDLTLADNSGQQAGCSGHGARYNMHTIRAIAKYPYLV